MLGDVGEGGGVGGGRGGGGREVDVDRVSWSDLDDDHSPPHRNDDGSTNNPNGIHDFEQNRNKNNLGRGPSPRLLALRELLKAGGEGGGAGGERGIREEMIFRGGERDRRGLIEDPMMGYNNRVMERSRLIMDGGRRGGGGRRFDGDDLHDLCTTALDREKISAAAAAAAAAASSSSSSSSSSFSSPSTSFPLYNASCTSDHHSNRHPLLRSTSLNDPHHDDLSFLHFNPSSHSSRSSFSAPNTRPLVEEGGRRNTFHGTSSSWSDSSSSSSSLIPPFNPRGAGGGTGGKAFIPKHNEHLQRGVRGEGLREGGRREIVGSGKTQPMQELWKGGKPEGKKRAMKACAVCRASHLACDYERPCSRCLRRGAPEECVDPIPGSLSKKRKRPISENLPALVSTLQERVELLQKNNESLMSTLYDVLQELREKTNETEPKISNEDEIISTMVATTACHFNSSSGRLSSWDSNFSALFQFDESDLAKPFYFDDLIHPDNAETSWSSIMTAPLPNFIVKIPLLRKDQEQLLCFVSFKNGSEGKVVASIQPHLTEMVKVTTSIRTHNQKNGNLQKKRKTGEPTAPTTPTTPTEGVEDSPPS